MNRLQALRKKRGLSLRALADLMGIDYSHIAYYERGERNLSVKVQQEFATFFGVSVDYLLGKTPEEMLNDFIASIKNDFMYQHLYDEGAGLQDFVLQGPIRTKFETIIIISGLSSQAALDAVYACAKGVQINEDFKED